MPFMAAHYKQQPGVGNIKSGNYSTETGHKELVKSILGCMKYHIIFACCRKMKLQHTNQLSETSNTHEKGTGYIVYFACFVYSALLFELHI